MQRLFPRGLLESFSNTVIVKASLENFKCSFVSCWHGKSFYFIIDFDKLQGCLQKSLK